MRDKATREKRVPMAWRSVALGRFRFIPRHRNQNEPSRVRRPRCGSMRPAHWGKQMNDHSTADVFTSARLIQQTRAQISILEDLIASASRMIDTSRTLLSELEGLREGPEWDVEYRRPEGRLA